ncbi:HigA family addiction module antitoxin [Mycetohabitans endofungorum]|uniref:HigA family addiction module antitoxin n=1 Tax=Mycetohabitans endofungorum TaxID=417203 RepID=UPI002B061972|nr:HigA family addiction module antitoxin [Mycetohabitans endofungorum]
MSWSITRTIIKDYNMMKHHPHPGELLREDVLQPLEIDVSEAAARLGYNRTSLSRVLNGHSGISPDLALRLERAGVSTARFWMNLQTNYELWQAEQREQPPVRPLQSNDSIPDALKVR